MTDIKETRSNRVILSEQGIPFVYAEAYKSLRTNLQFLSIDKNIKRILITSSIPGEGKTIVAINMAITLAETGAKVIVIDCDLRKPSIHKYLNLSSKSSGGLTGLLSKKAEVDECVTFLSDLNIFTIAAGPLPPNPVELLSSSRMAEVMDLLSEQYDYIVVDTPPVSVVTDAAAMSQNCDGVVFVVRQNSTKIESAQLAKKNLQNVGANVIGCVLNAFSAKTSKAYAYYSYKKYEYSYK